MTDTRKWPQECFKEVDWEHLDLAMTSKSNMYKMWRSKQHTGFRGSRVQVGKYSGQEYPDKKYPTPADAGKWQHTSSPVQMKTGLDYWLKQQKS